MFKAGRLPLHFRGDPDRTQYVTEHDGAPAGFVLVRGVAEPPLRVAEFFVVRRPVPDKPHVPPDVWIMMTTPHAGSEPG